MPSDEMLRALERLRLPAANSSSQASFMVTTRLAMTQQILSMFEKRICAGRLTSERNASTTRSLTCGCRRRHSCSPCSCMIVRPYDTHATLRLVALCSVLDGKRTRVLPRDFQIHPFRPRAIAINWLRYRVGAYPGVKLEIPLKSFNEERCPCLREGGWMLELIHKVRPRPPLQHTPVDPAQPSYPTPLTAAQHHSLASPYPCSCPFPCRCPCTRQARPFPTT